MRAGASGPGPAPPHLEPSPGARSGCTEVCAEPAENPLPDPGWVRRSPRRRERRALSAGAAEVLNLDVASLSAGPAEIDPGTGTLRHS